MYFSINFLGGLVTCHPMHCHHQHQYQCNDDVAQWGVTTTQMFDVDVARNEYLHLHKWHAFVEDWQHSYSWSPNAVGKGNGSPVASCQCCHQCSVWWCVASYAALCMLGPAGPQWNPPQANHPCYLRAQLLHVISGGPGMKQQLPIWTVKDSQRATCTCTFVLQLCTRVLEWQAFAHHVTGWIEGWGLADATGRWAEMSRKTLQWEWEWRAWSQERLWFPFKLLDKSFVAHPPPLEADFDAAMTTFKEREYQRLEVDFPELNRSRVWSATPFAWTWTFYQNFEKGKTEEFRKELATMQVIPCTGTCTLHFQLGFVFCGKCIHPMDMPIC